MCQKSLFLSFLYNSNIVHRAFPVLTSLAYLLGARRSATGSSTTPPREGMKYEWSLMEYEEGSTSPAYLQDGSRFSNYIRV